MKTNLVTRILSASVFVVLMGTAIFINQYVHALIFGTISILILFEYLRIHSPEFGFFQKVSTITAAGIIYTITFLHAFQIWDMRIFSILIPALIFVLIFNIYTKTVKLSPEQLVFSLAYIVLPFSSLLYIASDNGTYNYTYLISLFIFIWLNDSGAYLIGSSIGKHPLFKRISPNKTWEGTVGGISLALIASYFFNDFFPELTHIQWIIFALLTVIFAVYGDLYESKLKRLAGVKDSGTIMPGHGGLLDRFDSMLFSAPVILIYLILIDKV